MPRSVKNRLNMDKLDLTKTELIRFSQLSMQPSNSALSGADASIVWQMLRFLTLQNMELERRISKLEIYNIPEEKTEGKDEE